MKLTKTQAKLLAEACERGSVSTQVSFSVGQGPQGSRTHDAAVALQAADLLILNSYERATDHGYRTGRRRRVSTHRVCSWCPTEAGRKAMESAA